MAEWKTRAWRHDDLEKPSVDTVTVVEAEARIAVLERKIAALEAGR
jgi:uncharacterized small protein (DUF1192 family)